MKQALGKDRQAEIFLNGLSGKRPLLPVDFATLEQAARSKLSPEAFGYLYAGAGNGHGIANNASAFKSWQIRPRMLRGVEHPDLGIKLLHEAYSSPLMFCPVGVLELAHPKADLELASAAANTGVPMIYSNQASYSMEECSKIQPGHRNWFQLYFSKSRELTESLVGRAESCGCKGILLTLDTTLLGWRNIDLNRAYLPFLLGKGIAQYTSDPVFKRLMNEPESYPKTINKSVWPGIRNLYALLRSYPDSMINNIRTGNPIKAVRTFTNIYSRPQLSWEDISWLRATTKLPIFLKGILHPEDAGKAIDHGMDGLVISNHGGRQIDQVISSLDALVQIRTRIPGNYPVVLDSGVRSGTDVFIALALGADAVGLGRSYVFALALGGASGVEEHVKNVLSELSLLMSLTGCQDIKSIDPQLLVGQI